MDTRRNPSGISPLGSMLLAEDLSVHSAAIFVNKAVQAEAAGGGICSLTTLPSPTNVISSAAFLASSTGTFVCFTTPLNFDFFFWQCFLNTGCLRSIFHRFGVTLCEDSCACSHHKLRNNSVLRSQAFRVWKY